MNKAEQIAHLRSCLERIIAHLIDYRNNKPQWHKKESVEIRSICASEIFHRSLPVRTHWPIEGEDELSIGHCIEWGYAQTIRAYGEALFVIGGIDVMLEVSENIADRLFEGLREQTILSILNSKWDGIGAEGKGYWVA